MSLETACEVVHAGKSTAFETLHKIAPAGKSTSSEKNGNNKKHKNGDHWQSPDSNKKSKDTNLRAPRPPPSKYTNYTELVSLYEGVFLVTE